MTDSGAKQQSLLGHGCPPLQPQWGGDALPQDFVIRLAAQNLSDSSENDVGRVGVVEVRARVELQRQLGYNVVHILGQGVIATCRWGVVVSDTRSVRQQMANCDRRSRVVITNPEVGQILANERIEVESVLFDKLHDHRGRPQLRDRTDLEQRIRRRRLFGRHIQHAECTDVGLASRQDRNDGTRNPVLGGHAVKVDRIEWCHAHRPYQL
nr:hypothetical protein [Mycobacterium avium]